MIPYRLFLKIAVIWYIFMVIFLALAQFKVWESGFYIALGGCVLMIFIIHFTRFPDESMERGKTQ